MIGGSNEAALVWQQYSAGDSYAQLELEEMEKELVRLHCEIAAVRGALQ
jgi:hypothetical protein